MPRFCHHDTRGPPSIFLAQKTGTIADFPIRHRGDAYDLAIPLLWMPSTWLAVSEINGECWTHVLIDRLHGTCVRVIEAAAEWAPEKIEASLVS